MLPYGGSGARSVIEATMTQAYSEHYVSLSSTSHPSKQTRQTRDTLPSNTAGTPVKLEFSVALEGLIVEDWWLEGRVKAGVGMNTWPGR